MSETNGLAQRSGPDYTIAVLARTLDLLEALAEADGDVGTTELAARIGATKSAAYRILATLEARGYVSKDPSSSRYRLGANCAYLGWRALQALDLHRLAHPVLEALHHRFRETVNLGVLDGPDIVYVDMIESDRGLRMAAALGGRDPAYSTSIGKAVLAFLPPEERGRHLPEHLLPRTERTITSFADLDACLAGVRAAGYAEDLGENEAGVHCFGAPIFDHRGVPAAAISLSVPESRLSEGTAAHLASAVRAAAAEITHNLGGHMPGEQRGVPAMDGGVGTTSATRRVANG